MFQKLPAGCVPVKDQCFSRGLHHTYYNPKDLCTGRLWSCNDRRNSDPTSPERVISQDSVREEWIFNKRVHIELTWLLSHIYPSSLWTLCGHCEGESSTYIILLALALHVRIRPYYWESDIQKGCYMKSIVSHFTVHFFIFLQANWMGVYFPSWLTAKRMTNHPMLTWPRQLWGYSISDLSTDYTRDSNHNHESY